MLCLIKRLRFLLHDFVAQLDWGIPIASLTKHSRIDALTKQQVRYNSQIAEVKHQTSAV